MSCGALFFSDVPQAALACAINTPSILVSAESDFCVNLCVYEVNKLDVSWDDGTQEKLFSFPYNSHRLFLGP